jgi:hypothetical protein
MSKEFIRITANTEIPTEKEAQIRIILEGKVYDALYKKFMSTAPLTRLTDYSSFFSVTYQDLLDYVSTHPREVDQLLPWESRQPWEGMGIVRRPDGVYEIRDHDHGFIGHREETRDLSRVINVWLRRCLSNQGLGTLIPAR